AHSPWQNRAGDSRGDAAHEIAVFFAGPATTSGRTSCPDSFHQSSVLWLLLLASPPCPSLSCLHGEQVPRPPTQSLCLLPGSPSCTSRWPSHKQMNTKRDCRLAEAVRPPTRPTEKPPVNILPCCTHYVEGTLFLCH